MKFRFLKSKKIEKNPKCFLIFSVDIMIVFMIRMVDQEREREEELKQWYLPYQQEQYYRSMNN